MRSGSIRACRQHHLTLGNHVARKAAANWNYSNLTECPPVCDYNVVGEGIRISQLICLLIRDVDKIIIHKTTGEVLTSDDWNTPTAKVVCLYVRSERPHRDSGAQAAHRFD